MKKLISILILCLFYPGTYINVDDANASDNHVRLWPCGTKDIVKLGDSKIQVLSEWGEPTIKEVTGTKTSGIAVGKSLKAYTETTEVEESWFYNCGSNNFNTTLIFTGSKLTDIIRGSYGSGESYCDGVENNPNSHKK